MDDPMAAGLADDRPELVDRAWPAFAACSGAEPPTWEAITFHRDDLGRYAGRVTYDGVRAAVQLDADPSREVAVTLHELAHLWVGWEERALREGFASSLAACAYRRLFDEPEFEFHPRMPDAFVPPPVLLEWRTDGGLTDDEVELRYLLSYELARRLEDVLPPSERWNPRAGGTWVDLLKRVFHRVADRSDPRGPLALIGMDLYLHDVDRDGLSGQDEHRLGTGPLEFDTDGDGWWDGADPPANAIAAPRVEVCLGVPAEDGGILLIGGGPDQSGLAVSPMRMTRGVPVVLPGGDPARVWYQVGSISPLAPCGIGPARAGSWPMSEVEADGDGLVETVERELGTDPQQWDTDGDGFWDGAHPPDGAVPFLGTGLVCLGDETRWRRAVTWDGPDRERVSAEIVAHPSVGRRRFGLWTRGPAGARAWMELLAPARPKGCDGVYPVAASGRICLGTPHSARRVTFEVASPFLHEIEVVRLVDGTDRAYDVKVLPGERVELDIRFTSDTTWAWIVVKAPLDPCPP